MMTVVNRGARLTRPRTVRISSVSRARKKRCYLNHRFNIKEKAERFALRWTTVQFDEIFQDVFE